jgi:hypothetical protein
MTDAPGKAGVFLIGGQYGAPPGIPLSDHWSYRDDEGWAPIAAEDSPLADAIAYDWRSGYVVAVTEDGEAWKFDARADEWIEVATDGPQQG